MKYNRVFAAGALIGCLAPALAQADTVPAKDQQPLDDNMKAWVRAFNAKNVPAVVALYAGDAVAITPAGIFEGSALQNWIEGQLAAGGHDLSITVKNMQAHGNEVWRYGDWTGAFGDQPAHGYWSDIVVRVGDTWKIQQSAVNIVPAAAPAQATAETAAK